MNSLLKAKSTFSIEDIFLIYLNVDPGQFKHSPENFEWISDIDTENFHDESMENTLIECEDIFVIKCILLEKYPHVSPEKINKALDLCTSMEADCKNGLLEFVDNPKGFKFILTRKIIQSWFLEHQLDCPKELVPIIKSKKKSQSKTLFNEEQIKAIDNLMNKLIKGAEYSKGELHFNPNKMLCSKKMIYKELVLIKNHPFIKQNGSTISLDTFETYWRRTDAVKDRYKSHSDSQKIKNHPEDYIKDLLYSQMHNRPLF